MNHEEARQLVRAAWPAIIADSRQVLGGELHYQAVAYHCLRAAGVPARQVGMNVKQWIDAPVSGLYIERGNAKTEAYRGGFEPIPDIVLFAPEIEGNWQRRNFANTLKHMLMAIEVKASERANSRLKVGEIAADIAKLVAHRDEVAHRGGTMYPVMMVIDVALSEHERMRSDAVNQCQALAVDHRIGWMYASQETDMCFV